MRTVPQGNGIPTLGAPSVPDAAAAPATVHGHLRVPVSRESLVSRPSTPVRSPSNPEAGVEAAGAILHDDDEILVEDARAGVTPAEMVEQKLRLLLRTRGLSIELAGRARPVRGRG